MGLSTVTELSRKISCFTGRVVPLMSSCSCMGMVPPSGQYAVLWFRDNVRSHWAFRLSFVLRCRGNSGLTHILPTPVAIPTIGASGAVAGIMAPILFIPSCPECHLIDRFYYTAHLPAVAFLFLWFVMRFLMLCWPYDRRYTDCSLVGAYWRVCPGISRWYG